MDSHNNNKSNMSSSMQTSTGAIDHFFPTSITTSPHHFFDTAFLDTNSLSFPASTAATSPWAQPPPPQPTNSPNHPPAAARPSTAAPGPTGRASKKRSRASRRAPTTVLTTDTSNFRAMVQEFTGIPAPPFTSSSSSTSPLHFPRNSLLNPAPSFLLKPFPHKFQPPGFPSTSSLTSPLPPHNSFQSLLHSQLVVNMPPQQQQAMAASSSSGELRLPDFIGSGRDQTRRQHHHQQQQQNFPVVGPMPTEFRAEKGSEAREGLMEAWICSSD